MSYTLRTASVNIAMAMLTSVSFSSYAIQRASQFLHYRGLLLARPKQVSDQGLKVEPVVPSAVPGLESVV